MNLIRAHFDEVSAGYSNDADRGLWQFIRNIEARSIISMLPEINDSTKALDLGCGSGYYSDVLHRHGVRNITCVDFSEKMLSQIRCPNYQKIQSNIEEYRSAQKYDIILCAGALEFTKESQKVFENVSSMLNKSGCFILLYPRRSFLGYFYRIYHKQHGFSVKLYTKKDIQIFAKNAGLNYSDSTYTFPFSVVVKFT